MSYTAIILLVISAILHASWNVVSKREHPTSGFFLLSTIIAALSVVPIMIIRWQCVLLIPPVVWWCFVLTGFFLGVYFVALAGAYRSGDMSVAYPLLRSSPVIVVTFVTFVLGEGSDVSVQCVIGIVLVVVGCFLVPMKRFRDLRLKNYLKLYCLLAMVAALATSGYSITDDKALRILRSDIGMSTLDASLVYLGFQWLFGFVWLALFVLPLRRSRGSFVEAVRTSKKAAGFTGLAVSLAYILVLVSMASVENVSYVVAFRQLSIPVGAMLGVVLLKEPRHPPKLAGVATIFVGLMLVGTG